MGKCRSRKKNTMRWVFKSREAEIAGAEALKKLMEETNAKKLSHMEDRVSGRVIVNG